MSQLSTRNGNMLLNGMLVVSFLILWKNMDHPNILVPLFSFLGFIMFVVLKLLFVLKQRKNNTPK